MLRWLGTNLRTFLLAFALALAVWVTAVTSADPDVTQAYPTAIPIEYLGQDPGLIMTGSFAHQVQVTLRAPRSIWDKLTSGSNSVHAVVDLTGLGAGSHMVNVQLQINARPVRIISVAPKSFVLGLEPLITETLPIQLNLIGDPAIGYKVGDVVLTPSQVVLSGPKSVVEKVKQVDASVDISNARQSIQTSLPLEAVAADGSSLSGVTIHPDTVQVDLQLAQLGGYRDLAVKVVTVGKLASGYRLNNVVASPLIVTVYSENIPLIENLPGYVETMPLDLSGASSNIDTKLSLNLPGGVLLIGEQTVSVQIEIVPIEGSLTVAFRPVEVIGLAPGLKVQLSPATVDVILSGPLPVLDSLSPSDVHVRLDLTGLGAGTYQLTPKVVIAKQDVVLQSILPGTVEVVISKEATPTP
ncbi:MAG TPA: CdaR family protein [Anaerolineales bacterium]|nr:CdaR family protein [Anaerolineales bacterium]